jgi:hypothetical protein
MAMKISKKKKKKQETKNIWQVFSYNVMFANGCVYPSGTFLKKDNII